MREVYLRWQEHTQIKYKTKLNRIEAENLSSSFSNEFTYPIYIAEE